VVFERWALSGANVSLDNLEKLAHAFEINVADLFIPDLDWRL